MVPCLVCSPWSVRSAWLCRQMRSICMFRSSPFARRIGAVLHPVCSEHCRWLRPGNIHERHSSSVVGLGLSSAVLTLMRCRWCGCPPLRCLQWQVGSGVCGCMPDRSVRFCTGMGDYGCDEACVAYGRQTHILVWQTSAVATERLTVRPCGEANGNATRRCVLFFVGSVVCFGLAWCCSPCVRCCFRVFSTRRWMRVFAGVSVVSVGVGVAWGRGLV